MQTKFAYTHIANRFARCGDLHYLGRIFRSLRPERRRLAVEFIDAGYSPDVALEKAKRPSVEGLLPYFDDDRRD